MDGQKDRSKRETDEKLIDRGSKMFALGKYWGECLRRIKPDEFIRIFKKDPSKRNDNEH